MNETTKTYVEYLYPGALFSEYESKVVAKRDPKAVLAKLPQYAFAFRFYDQTSKQVNVDGEAQTVYGKRKNESGAYYPDGELYTAPQLEKIDAKRYDILISNMRNNDYKAVVKTRRGNFQPFEEKDQIL